MAGFNDASQEGGGGREEPDFGTAWQIRDQICQKRQDMLRPIIQAIESVCRVVDSPMLMRRLRDSAGEGFREARFPRRRESDLLDGLIGEPPGVCLFWQRRPIDFSDEAAP